MSKKFKGKLCVYCVERISVSSDHVFAREFFLPEDRNNLPKVPACSKCNGNKSELEHYVTMVLPFGGRHESAKANLREMIPKRLKKNIRLHHLLKNGSTKVWVNQNKLLIPTIALPFDSDRLKALFELITRGLLWFHWGVYLTQDHIIDVIMFTRRGEEYFEKNFISLRPRACVRGNLGKGTIVYYGAQGVDCPEISVWYFSLFGGVVLCDLKDSLVETSSRIGVMTGPKEIGPEIRANSLVFS